MEEKKTSTKTKIAIGVGALVVLASLGGKGGEKAEKSDTATPSPTAAAPAGASQQSPAAASPSAAPAPTEGAKPGDPAFVVQRAEACKRYEAASNDIKKSAVFSELENAAQAAGHRIEGVEGTVQEIKTPSAGGESALVKIATPWGTFNNNDVFQGNKREITKGSKVYAALGELDEGAKVKISASMIVPEKNLFSEKDAVCGTDWIAKFDKIEKAN